MLSSTASQAKLKASEACGLLLAEECRERRGVLDPKEVYLAILDGRPLLACRDCRGLVRGGGRSSPQEHPLEWRDVSHD